MKVTLRERQKGNKISLYLDYWIGLKNYEISEYLNISVKTVEAHITKAFSILKTKLG